MMFRHIGIGACALFCSVFILGAFTCRRPGEVSLQRSIVEHQSCHPNFEVQDAYKLIYQSVFGVAHIMEDREAAWQYLRREYDSVEPSEDEPLLEAISSDGDVVRVNLRSFKATNISLEKLFEVLIQSAQEIHGTEEDFLRLWEEFKNLVHMGKLPFDRTRVDEFDADVREAHFPPVHHSEGYEKANRPAYRVVKRDLFESAFDLSE